MKVLTIELLDQACRLFLELAYPAGLASIPEKRRAFGSIPAGAALSDYLPGGPFASGIGQTLRCEDGALRGYTFRLGCAHFPHLKLQATQHNEGSVCVFAVDTHDALPASGILAPDHPDFGAWMALQKRNRSLKEAIERAWDEAGLWTFNRLLKEELKSEQQADA